MQFLKKIFLVILFVIVLVLIVAAFVDGKIRYEKYVDINAPVERVWPHISTLSALNSWSPWVEQDPNMKTTVEGKDGTAGAKFCWQSDKMGKGCQAIKSVKPFDVIETNLKFLTPYESEAAGFVKLSPQKNYTRATWGFSSVIPYPFRIIKLFTNAHAMLGKDYARGLEKLKKLSEAPLQ